jgi:hypothetical protein
LPIGPALLLGLLLLLLGPRLPLREPDDMLGTLAVASGADPDLVDGKAGMG